MQRRKEGGHLQIRDLWSPAPHHSARQPGVRSVGPISPVCHNAPVVSATADWPIGLQGLRPGVPYTRGIPSPRLNAQEWDLAFRTKLIAVIARRRRRAYWSIGLAGTGFVAVTGGLVLAIALGTSEPEVATGDVATRHSAVAATEVAISPPDAVPTREPIATDQLLHVRGVVFDAEHVDQRLPAVWPQTASLHRDVSASNAAVAEMPMKRTPLVIRNASLASGEFILVRGVPDELTLSDGMPTSAGTWVLGLEQSRLVDILSPAGYKGRFRILVEVMGAQGRPLLRHSAQIELPTSEIIVILARPSSLPAEDKRTVPQQHAVHAPTGTRQAETTRRKLDSAWSTSVAADPGPGTAETPVIAEGGNGIRERQPNLLQPAYGLGAAR